MTSQVAGLALIASLVCGCGKSAEDPKRVEADRYNAELAKTEQAAKVARAAAALIDAAPADARDVRAELKFPATNIDTPNLLQHGPDAFAKVYGKGTVGADGRTRYKYGEGALDILVVRFEGGRAVSLELPSFKSGTDNYDEAQQAEFEHFFTLATEPAGGEYHYKPIGGHRIWAGDAFSGAGLGVYQREFHDKLEAQARKADEAGHTARIEFVRTIAAALATDPTFAKSTLSIAIGEPDTTLKVTSTCTPQILKFPVDTVGEPMRKVGFEMLACADMTASERL